jgi:hypothetical protein
MTNDLAPGTAFGAMTFDDDTYSLSGNLLTLTGDVAGCICNADLKLGASVAFSGTSNGAIDINGQTLTARARFNGPINGNGTIISPALVTDQIPPNSELIWLQGTHNFTGTIRGVPSGGGLVLGEACSLPNATIAVALIQQPSTSATLGDVTITPSSLGYVLAGGPGGVLHTKSLALSAATPPAQGGGVLAFVGPGGSSQIDVTGTVTLNGAPLATIPAGTPAVGQSFTIIRNDGTDPVAGTFAGLPEGAILHAASAFRVSYVGGDGNDVVLTVVADTSAVLTQSANTTRVGESWTLTDVVSSPSGTPTGSVSFAADGFSLGSVPLVNGAASLTTTLTSAGTHNVTATFTGTGGFADNASNIVHTVTRGQSRTSISSDSANTSYGQTVHFTIAVNPQSGGGVPAGTVTVFADAAPLGTIPLVNGTATLAIAALHAGTKAITATYNGDDNFDGSTASAIQQNVSKASTVIDARLRASIFAGESPIVTVFVSLALPSAAVPSGSVTISEAGVNLGTQALSGGSTAFALSPLPAGDHTLAVNYAGDADTEGSSAIVAVSVIAPSISIHGTRATEGNSGVTSISLMVSLSAPVSQTVRVSFTTVSGSATEGEDYQKASGVIEFAPGEVIRAIELHIFGDTFPEPDESFSVLLSDAVNATIETPSAIVVIVNDDQVPPRRRAARP